MVLGQKITTFETTVAFKQLFYLYFFMFLLYVSKKRFLPQRNKVISLLKIIVINVFFLKNIRKTDTCQRKNIVNLNVNE